MAEKAGLCQGGLGRYEEPAISPAVPRSDLPDALDERGSFWRALAGRRPVIFSDYDGVLTPIVATPDLAVLAADMRSAIEEVAAATTFAVISGRDLADVRAKVAVDGIYYAGSHGFDILAPDGTPAGQDLVDRFAPYLIPLAEATDDVEGRLVDVEGVLIERKRFATAIHYRNVDRRAVPQVTAAVKDAAARYGDLAVTTGKEIYEYRPDFDWDKGRALEWLVGELDLDVTTTAPVYLGDDTTDEDAFRSIRDHGLGVVVGLDGPDTLARFTLADCGEVREFLHAVASVRSWPDE